MKRNFLSVITLLLMALLLISCGGKKEGTTTKGEKQGTERRLRVGTTGTFAPFTFADENGNLTGFDVELAKEIGKRLNLEVEFVQTPWDSMFLGLESKKFDMIANQVAKNPEREKKYLFGQGYTVSKIKLIVKKGRTDIKTMADLIGKRVVVGLGTNYSKILTEYNEKEANNGITIDFYEGNIAAAMDEVAQGTADATMHNELIVNYFVKQNGETVELTGDSLQTSLNYHVFRKDSEELRNQVNKVLDEMRADGTLTKISEKWFGGDYTKE